MFKNPFKSKPKQEIPCKTPKEIDILYRSYKTRLENLKLNMEDLSKDSHYHKLVRLNAKIHVLEVILKIKKPNENRTVYPKIRVLRK